MTETIDQAELTVREDAKMILAAIKRCADKKSAEFLNAEDKIKTAMQAAKEESSGDATDGMIRASAKLATLGVDEDTIPGLTAIDTAADGTLDSSLCDATAQIMHAELDRIDDRDDDATSVHCGSSSSSGRGADRSGSGYMSRTSRNNEQRLRDLHKERGLELKAEDEECLQRFKQATIATHRALRN